MLACMFVVCDIGWSIWNEFSAVATLTNEDVVLSMNGGLQLRISDKASR